MPNSSCNSITGCCKNATPLCAVPDGSVVVTNCPAEPASAVAVNTSGSPANVSPVVAANVFVPTPTPNVHDVTAANPVASVVTAPVGFTVPPPTVTTNVTSTPGTPLPFASVTIAAGGVATAVPATTVCPSPAPTAIAVATPALTTLVYGLPPIAPPFSVIATLSIPLTVGVYVAV